MFYDISKHRV